MFLTKPLLACPRTQNFVGKNHCGISSCNSINACAQSLTVPQGWQCSPASLAAVFIARYDVPFGLNI